MASEPTDDESMDQADDELLAELIDLETQKRLWVRAIVPILQLRRLDSDPSDRVQLAFDQLMIASSERLRRILRSDLPTECDD